MGSTDKIKNVQQKDDTGTKCPYCNVTLDPAPKRKTKCPSCDKDIYVRIDPFHKQKTHYLKREDALSLDMVRQLHINEKAFTDAKNKALANQSLGDIIWALLNSEKHKAARTGDWQTISNISWNQARYLYEVGREYLHVQQVAMKEQLQRGLVQGITHVTILASKDERTCKKCASQDGVTLTIKEALDKMPIPVKCDNEEGWCRCVYAYKIER